MAIQTVNVGTTPNDGTGDPARTAFIKLNDNFTQPENAASRLVATTGQAQAGTAGVLTDAAGVHAAIRGLAVGTVSQSGGVPTGAIIERGSNANGAYTKFADGTMICMGSVSPSGVAWELLVKNLPAAFINNVEASVVGTFNGSTSSTTIGNEMSLFGIIVSASGLTVNYRFNNTHTAYSNNYIAIGRWY